MAVFAGNCRVACGQTFLDRPGFENLEARGLQRYTLNPTFDCAPIINAYLANMGEGDNKRNRGVFLPAGSWSISQSIIMPLKSGGAIVGVSPNTDLYGDVQAEAINGAITRIVARGLPRGGPVDVPMMTVDGAGLKLEGIFFQGAGGTEAEVRNPANWADIGLFIDQRENETDAFGPGQVHGDWLQFGACDRAIVCGRPGVPDGNQAEEIVFQRLNFIDCNTAIEINNFQSVNHSIQDLSASGCDTVLDLKAGGVFEIGLLYVGKLRGTNSPTIIRTGNQSDVSPNANYVHIGSLRLDGSLTATKIWDMTAPCSFVVRIDALGVASNAPPPEGTAAPYVILRGGGRLTIGSAMNLTENFIEGHEAGGVAPVITINNAVMWPGDDYRKLVRSTSTGKTIVRLSGVVERGGVAIPISEEQIWEDDDLVEVRKWLADTDIDTSGKLRGILTDENGTGAALFDSATGVTLLTPALFSPEVVGIVDIDGGELTPSGSTPTINAIQTWNTSGTPTALKLNVTDTASNAASLLLDLQVGGASKFNVGKDGTVTLTMPLGAASGGTGLEALGTGVPEALTEAVNSLDGFVTYNGDLGAPVAGTLTSCTDLPISSGVSGLGAGVATFLTAPSSANLASALTTKIGTGLVVFDTSPTFTTDARFPAGAVTAPGIAWSADADGTGTGFYRSAANEIAIACNGVQRTKMTSTGITVNGTGTIFTDSINGAGGQFTTVRFLDDAANSHINPCFEMNTDENFYLRRDGVIGFSNDLNNAAAAKDTFIGRVENIPGEVEVTGTSGAGSIRTGGLRTAIVSTMSSPYNADGEDHTILVNASNGAVTVNLPAAGASTTGRVYVIKKTDSSTNAVTIDGNGTETIDGTQTKSITTQYNSYIIQSDGTNWQVLAGVGL